MSAHGAEPPPGTSDPLGPPAAVRRSYSAWRVAVLLGLILPGLVLLVLYADFRASLGFAPRMPDQFPQPSLGAVLVVIVAFLGTIRFFARRMLAGSRRGRVGVAVVGGVWGALMLVTGLYNIAGGAFWAVLALGQAVAISVAVVLMFRPDADAYFTTGSAIRVRRNR